MPVEKRDIACFAHGGAKGTGEGSARRLWHFVTEDNAATVEGAGYFNDLSKEVQKGDWILASLNINVAPEPKIYIVTSEQGVTPVAVGPYPIV